MTLAQKRPYGDITSGSEMEIMGYSKLQADSPPETMVKEVERYFRSQPNQADQHLVYGAGDHDACENFLKFGIQDKEFDRVIEEVIGRPSFFVHQGPVIIHSSEHPTDLGTGAAHPSRNGVSIFRVLSSKPGISATLQLYPMSHHFLSTECGRLGGATKSFNLRSTDILFVRGALNMEISLPAGGSLVWKGFSEDPWGTDTPSSSEAFAFMRIYSKRTPWRAGSARAR